MGRWLVELDGDRFDLEEFPRWFPDGDIYAIGENNRVYLEDPALELFSLDSQVYELALQAIDEFSAVITLLLPSFQRPNVGHVIRESNDGKRQTFVYLSAKLTARSKLRAKLTVSSAEEDRGPVGPTQAQILLAGSRLNYRLEEALSLWADPLKTWPRLYRVLEEIARYRQRGVQSAGLCSSNQRERFTRSANAAEIAGLDAGRALGRFSPPQNPMSVEEATEFIAGLLRATLTLAASGQPSTS